MEVVNAYVDGSSIVVWRRDGEVLRHTSVSAEYVVYLKAADVPADLRQMMGRSQYVKSVRAEGEWLRVGWSDYESRDRMCFGTRDDPGPFLRRGIQTFEGDVSPVRRLFTDQKVVIQKPRRAYFDLETDSRVPFSRKEEMRVLSWAVTDDAGRKMSAVLREESDRAERDLIEQFWEYLRPYEQLIAWNLDNFDKPVIEARSQGLGCRVDPRRWLWLDQLVLFRRMNMHSSESGDEKQSMRLQDIAMKTVGEGKNDFDASKTYEAWAAGGESRERLRTYNEQDTALLPKIEHKSGYIDLFATLADACCVLPNSQGINPTQQMDGFLLGLGLEKGIHFPTKRYREGIEQFKGAYVMEPKVHGVMHDVHVADFAAMYPSIILTWNMSPETKRAEDGPDVCRSPLTGQRFDANAEGILPAALTKLMHLRKHWNEVKSTCPPGTPEWHDADRRSMAYKVAANSFYGVVGSPFSRYFDKTIAESITQNGVWLIKQTIAEAEKRGMSVIYGDTDSIFVTGSSRTEFEAFVRWCNAELYPPLLRSVGCTKNEIKIAYEKMFARIVMTSAKRYAGSYAHYKGKEATAASKPEIKGLEFKRGDASLLARRLQEEVIHTVLAGSEDVTKYRAILDRVLAHVLHDELPPTEVIISKSLSRPLGQYARAGKEGEGDGVPAHVRIARELKERGEEVTEGTRIEYFVVDGSRSPSVVRPAREYGDVEVDRYHLWENLIYPPTMRFLEAAFPDSDWKASYERVRPAKPHGRRQVVSEGQLGFDLAAPTKPGPQSPFEVELEEGWILEGTIERVREIVRKHPGVRPLVLRIRLASGATAVLESKKVTVSGSNVLFSDVEELKRWVRAAIQDWEASCAE